MQPSALHPDPSAAASDLQGATLEPLAAALGARLHGFDARAATVADANALKALLVQHGVLFIPQATQLTLEQHVAFGRLFGDLEPHPNLADSNHIAHPEIFELKASVGGVANEWHTDLTFLREPSALSVLHMVQCPPVGGDTMWRSLAAAYEALSPPLQQLCEGLTALHDALPHNKPEKMTVHPVVRVHPVTGRKCLYVSEHFTRRIVELSSFESTRLLALLTAHIANPRFHVRYKWTNGCLALWDNTQTSHCVLQDFVGERHIQRVTICGDHPTPVKGARQWAPAVGNAGAQSRFDRQLFEHLKRDMPGIAGGNARL